MKRLLALCLTVSCSSTTNNDGVGGGAGSTGTGGTTSGGSGGVSTGGSAGAPSGGAAGAAGSGGVAAAGGTAGAGGAGGTPGGGGAGSGGTGGNGGTGDPCDENHFAWSSATNTAKYCVPAAYPCARFGFSCDGTTVYTVADKLGACPGGNWFQKGSTPCMSGFGPIEILVGTGSCLAANTPLTTCPVPN